MGGAFLFALEPKQAIINDINKPLINTYNFIKNEVNGLLEELYKLDKLEVSEELYYELRNRFNNKLINNIYDLECSALFLFLNKHCYNGLYRSNKKGLFNCPYGHKGKVKFFDKDNLLNISKYLKNVVIYNEDFEIILNKAEYQDFVFIDSPYIPINKKSFTSYNKDNFDYDDHLRLANQVKNLDKKGVKFILTNSFCDLTLDLYKDFCINTSFYYVNRHINCKTDKRKGIEVIITNIVC